VAIKQTKQQNKITKQNIKYIQYNTKWWNIFIQLEVVEDKRGIV